ncbi:MAG: hypothetical protein IIB11_04755 [Chloroflexi bacterium]|nr:hypothetical protein [Chloroflexota bacterium]
MPTNKPTSSNKFGARVYLMDNKTILILQTVKRGQAQNAPYVVDKKPSGNGEIFLDVIDDKGIADAVRAALAGKL